jgi:hypothetical protein
MAKNILRAIFLCTVAVTAAAGSIYIYENREPEYIRLSAEQKHYYTGLLERHGLAPVEYVTSRFKDYSVVLLGEPHRVSEHYSFLTELLGPLRAAGIDCLAMELFHTTAQKDIERLMQSGKFDEALARRIVLQAFPGFYYKELYDVLRKAWEINRRHGGFSILALGGQGDRGMAELVSRTPSRAAKCLFIAGPTTPSLGTASAGQSSFLI